MLWSSVGGNIDKFSEAVEMWYNETTDRIIGWYRRRTRYMLFIVGLLIAFAFNADTISIVKKLSKDSKARKNLVELSIQHADQLESNQYLYEQIQL